MPCRLYQEAYIRAGSKQHRASRWHLGRGHGLQQGWGGCNRRVCVEKSGRNEIANVLPVDTLICVEGGGMKLAVISIKPGLLEAWCIAQAHWIGSPINTYLCMCAQVIVKRIILQYPMGS